MDDDQSYAGGGTNRADPAWHSQLVIDAPEVGRHRSFPHTQALPDLLCCQSLSGHGQDFPLTLRQYGRRFPLLFE
jgi:hypothetical protein